MGKPRSIELSRKVFGSLLNLYPAAHRRDYGTAMLQVFTEQSRGAYAQKGVFGVILLWLRTLPDVGYSSLLEHLTAPGAAWGLMEPVPGAPLPWKGVLLVLLPGLVYLVSQVAQLNGDTWYLTVYYRAAFLLIIPVLVVWAVTRRFPIWGLIPLGLLFRLVQDLGYETITLPPYYFAGNPWLHTVLLTASQVQDETLIPVSFFAAAIILLAWRTLRRQRPPRAFWLLLGAYLLVAGAQIVYDMGLQPQSFSLLLQFRESAAPYHLYGLSALLLLVFAGTLLVKRHGFFAILVPLGYMLPTMLVGVSLFDNFESITGSNPALVVVGSAVLAYRALLSLIVPIWMARSASQTDKIRVVVVSVAIAVLIQTAMQFFPNPINEWPTVLVFVALDGLKTAGAVALAITLYRSVPAAGQPSANPALETPALSAGKA
jgi:hypothetical protein